MMIAAPLVGLSLSLARRPPAANGPRAVAPTASASRPPLWRPCCWPSRTNLWGSKLLFIYHLICAPSARGLRKFECVPPELYHNLGPPSGGHHWPAPAMTRPLVAGWSWRPGRPQPTRARPTRSSQPTELTAGTGCPPSWARACSMGPHRPNDQWTQPTYYK